MTRLLIGGQLTRALWLGLEFKRQDAWVGLFWRRFWSYDRASNSRSLCTGIWICLLPMLPLHIEYQGRMEAQHD